MKVHNRPRREPPRVKADDYQDVTIFGEQASLMRLEPGDIVVLLIGHPIDDAEFHNLSKHLKDTLPEVRFVVLDGGDTELRILRPAEESASG